MHFIGFMYYNGYGVSKNDDSAKYWYDHACKAGSEDACKEFDSLFVEK
jgi:TPR repeat protein